MIVFYLFVSIITLLTVVAASSIVIDIKDISIKDAENLKKIYIAIEEKKYDKILNYINIEGTIKIALFMLVPIRIIKLNNSKMKNIIKGIIIKDLKWKKQKGIKYKLEREKQKETIKKVMKKITPHLKIDDADLKIKIGLSNAGVTAIVTGILNIVFSIVILEFINESVKSKVIQKHNTKFYNDLQKFNYVVKPIYSSNFEFALKTNVKMKIPIYSVI